MTPIETPAAVTRDSDIERFAYVASHDLSEPLRMVSGYLGLLSERYSGQLDQDADDFIALALDGAERMQAYIDDLRTYSRIGRRQEESEHVDCAALVEEALERLRPTVEETGAEITVGALPTVVGERTQLGLVFDQLVGNALKFRGLSSPRVAVSATAVPGAWKIMVTDNGMGVEAHEAERSFGMFETLNGRKYPGTGMGLAIVRKAVESHGGQIWVEPVASGGSTFCLLLPAQVTA